MPYNQNPNYYGGQQPEQEDAWLDDIMSLIDEEPGGSGRAVKEAPRSAQSAPAFQNRPPQNQGYLDPNYSDPASWQINRRQPVNPNSADFRVSKPQYMPNFQNMAEPPVPGVDFPDPDQAPPQKRSFTAVIVLGITILLELLAIAGVALSWMRWMQ